MGRLYTMDELKEERKMDNEIRSAWNSQKLSERKAQELGNEQDTTKFAKVVKCPSTKTVEHEV